MITGIVVALPEELNTLTRFPGFTGARKIDKGTSTFLGNSVVVAYSGAGPNNARLAAELLITNGATRLISWGCAAALSETLKPGDLLLAGSLIDSCNNKISIESEWRNYAESQLLKYLPVHCGCLAESEIIVSTSKDKIKLRSQTAAIALDMESIAVAKVAGHYSLPFLTIRAIADPVRMDLPTSVNYALNNEGDIVLSRLLFHLACHPAQLKGLIKLGLYFNNAKSTLKLVAKHLNKILDFNDNFNHQLV